ncbi:unnamed protein product [Cochlearia groenlandica]
MKLSLWLRWHHLLCEIVAVVSEISSVFFSDQLHILFYSRRLVRVRLDLVHVDHISIHRIRIYMEDYRAIGLCKSNLWISAVEEEGPGNQHTQGSVDHKVVTKEEEIYPRWRRLPAVGSNGANLRLPRVSNKASAIDAWLSGDNFLFSFCDVVFGYWTESNLGLNVRIGLFVAR